MTYYYKKLTSSDVDLLKQLLSVFGQAFNEPETYQSKVPSEKYLGALLAKEHFIVLVALDKDGVVGGLVAYVLDKFEQERREIYIYDLAVFEGVSEARNCYTSHTETHGKLEVSLERILFLFRQIKLIRRQSNCMNLSELVRTFLISI